MKLHWLAFDVTRKAIRRVFYEYGDVKECQGERLCACVAEVRGTCDAIARFQGAATATHSDMSEMSAPARTLELQGDNLRLSRVSSSWMKKNRNKPKERNCSSHGVYFNNERTDAPCACSRRRAAGSKAPRNLGVAALAYSQTGGQHHGSTLDDESPTSESVGLSAWIRSPISSLSGSVKAATLNVRGLASRKKHTQLYRLVMDHDLDIIAVQETKVESEDGTESLLQSFS
ncbi:hypothetical protein HPB52_007912 [Rhipicephalus sanguineus]|uniref:Uncharacterized protein n=1 Tax=Rhipicephalus sanguineus TaxID=34632 RepID=A0A9D4PV53_RHISA|nr:hypothetical protein HPB52_007912 [Rhipicephalus sanguineus]